MQKIVTDPAFIKLQRVVESCETEQHFNVAKRYSELVKEHLLRSIKTKGVFGEEILNSDISLWIKRLFEEYKGVKNG